MRETLAAGSKKPRRRIPGSPRLTVRVDGVFRFNAGARFAEITDGLSNTLLTL